VKTLEWKSVDKSKWARGPWDAEPDKRQWKDEATGLPCLIVRNQSGGNLCGYVGVPPGHPWHGKRYQDIEDNVKVHGGLTFSDRCAPKAEADPSRYVCHIAEPGDPEPWWLGFDCAHAWDQSPGIDALLASRPDGHLFRDHDKSYRDFDYVTREVERLAQQAAEVTP
jgi:hypothetical protein